MALRLAARSGRQLGYPLYAHAPVLASTVRGVHSSHPSRASASPFPEPTSPNPTLTKYAEATERLHGYGSYIMQCLPKFIQQFSVLKDELTLHVAPSAVIPILTFLRDHSQCQFKSLMDISDKRFEVVYHLLSIQYAARIRVKTYVSEADAVPSATSIFSGANWYEREAWDLFGIFFKDHPDLRRILTDYGFEGHPLRKTSLYRKLLTIFLKGYTEVRYDEEKKRVVYEPLQLTQAVPSLSPWEQVGEGSEPRKPQDFKPIPPPKAEEPQKK
ncbi:NADH or F420H2 dehydrogenase [Russula earlei]|uniref:NADH or F420H2 dehydrogenase n=1 Tax=Russula earlei TaxID=71964 RepID=A0ACC0UKX3_9AGAM|nr:NADH or F420H2 dehydrogenase [Russula earlei]